MQTIDQWIEASGLFITDLEQIADLLAEAKQVFLYDTAAISVHEHVFHEYGKTLVKYVQQDKYPIVITDTIAKEMRLLERATGERYAAYLRQFQPLLFIREADFFSLLMVDYDLRGARVQFLKASLKAFGDMQPLREQLAEFRKMGLPGIESRILSAYHTLFAQYHDRNKGEVSLLWLSCILECMAPNARVTFIGIDHDLYQYVTRCYLQTPYEPSRQKPQDIALASSDTLLQATHLLLLEEETSFDLHLYMDVYRNPERYVLFFERWSGIRSHQIQRKQFLNEHLEAAVRAYEVDVIY